MNELLKVPVSAILKNNLKNAIAEIEQLKKENNDLRYKNSVLIKKGKELEKELLESNQLDKTELKDVLKETRKEELYSIIRKENERLIEQHKKDKRIIDDLVYRLNKK